MRELFRGIQPLKAEDRSNRVRDFLLRIHRVFNVIDSAPITTIAAVHGVVFGGGFELALTCDMIVADRTGRFCFPELRLGLVPGFGGIPRMKRDIGNGLVRDLLLTGRSINANKASAAGLVSQVVAPGEAFRVARSVALQATKFDRRAAQVAKEFIKPIPYAELQEEIRLFCELMGRPAVEEAFASLLKALTHNRISHKYRKYYKDRFPLCLISSKPLHDLLKLASEHFQVPVSELNPDEDFFKKLKINSLQALDLLTKLEHHFNVELPDYELQGVTDFRTLAEKIQARL